MAKHPFLSDEWFSAVEKLVEEHGAEAPAQTQIVMNLTSSLIENDMANEGGSAVFFVSNNMTGSINITDSITRNNPRGTFETPNLPGFYVIAKQPANVVNSMILR